MKQFRSLFNNFRKAPSLGARPVYNFMEKESFPFIDTKWVRIVS